MSIRNDEDNIGLVVNDGVQSNFSPNVSSDKSTKDDFMEKTSIKNDSYIYGNDVSFFRSFVDSFKRAENSNKDIHDTALDVSASRELLPRNENLKRNIKPRHVVMMSLGAGIGTGLLVGNGDALVTGGPAGLLIGYAIMGSCLYSIIQAAGEMAVAYPTLTGSYNNYPSFLVDKAFCFATTTIYCIQWLVVFPLEIISSAITIQYWTTSVSSTVFCAIFYVLIISINLFGSAGYAEADFIFSTCKVLMFAGFYILGIIINCGGAGDSGYIGARYWNDPGAFNGDHAVDRFKAVVSTLVTAAFAFGGTESVALTASEQSNPRKSIPSAAKKVVYRIIVIFLGTITLVGFLVPYDSSSLMGSSSSSESTSPYVLAVSLHGVSVVPHLINAVIVISVLSVGNLAYFCSSRILLCLSQIGYMPKFLQYVDRKGRPLYAMIVSTLVGAICFVSASSKETEVFTWLLAISGLSQLFTWSSICLAHVRFRKALKAQGKSLNELGFKSQTGVWGSYYAIFIMFLILIGQFWVSLFPIGEQGANVKNFFENYLALPIFIVLYLGYKFVKKDWRVCIPSDEVDLVSHRKIFDEEILRQEDLELKEKLKNSPFWNRFINFWC